MYNNMRSSDRNWQQGFTLLEIMIALAVFAIVAVAVTKSATASIRQTRQIEETTLAYWIAQNQLNQLRLAERSNDTFPDPGRRNEKVVMAERDWNVEIEVSNTENVDIRRIEISVYLNEKDQAAAVFTGFLGKY